MAVKKKVKRAVRKVGGKIIRTYKANKDKGHVKATPSGYYVLGNDGKVKKVPKGTKGAVTSRQAALADKKGGLTRKSGVTPKGVKRVKAQRKLVKKSNRKNPRKQQRKK